MAHFLHIDDIDFDQDELMYGESDEPTPRVFITSNGNTLLGLVAEENSDSFLLALPSRILRNENGVFITPYVPVPVVRIFKSNLVAAAPCFSQFEREYLSYVVKVAEDVVPGLVTEELMEKFKNRISIATEIDMDELETEDDEEEEMDLETSGRKLH